MDALQLIDLYQNLFYVCLVLTILGFGSAIFCFFKFRILDLRAIDTGKARTEKVRSVAAENAKTGNLRMNVYGLSGDIGVSGDLGNTGRIGKTGSKKRRVVTPPAQEHTEPMQQPLPEVRDIPERYETAVLQTDAPETAVLQEYAPETVLLRQQAQVQPVAQAAADAVPPGFLFRVTENTLLIHTDEII